MVVERKEEGAGLGENGGVYHSKNVVCSKKSNKSETPDVTRLGVGERRRDGSPNC